MDYDFKSAIMPNNCLPTNLDLINHIFYLSETNGKARSKFVESTTMKLTELWEKTTIPLLSVSTRRRRVRIVLSKCEKQLKSNINIDFNRDNSRFRQSRIYIYRANSKFWSSLMDISDPKFVNNMSDIDRRFLLDQRTSRQSTIEGYRNGHVSTSYPELGEIKPATAANEGAFGLEHGSEVVGVVGVVVKEELLIEADNPEDGNEVIGVDGVVVKEELLMESDNLEDDNEVIGVVVKEELLMEFDNPEHENEVIGVAVKEELLIEPDNPEDGNEVIGVVGGVVKEELLMEPDYLEDGNSVIGVVNDAVKEELIIWSNSDSDSEDIECEV